MNDDTWNDIKAKIKTYSDYICYEYNKGCSVSNQKILFNEKRFYDVRPNYEKYRTKIHQLMQNHSLKNFSDPNINLEEINNIDCHKVAVAFLAAIIKAQPMQPLVKNPSMNLRTANELLSFLLCVDIVISFGKVKNKNFKVILPKCCNMTSYQDHFVKITYRIKRILGNNENFDIAALFLISHIFFLLDEYLKK